MGLTVSGLIEEFGAYYENNGQNSKRVLKLLTQPTKTETFCTPIKTDETIFRLAQSSVSDLVQAFQKAWTPKGTDTIIPNKIEMHHMKVDIELYPDDIEATWLGFLASGDQTRKDWPLVKWLIEGHYLPKIRENLELSEIYKGVRDEPTPGTAGATGSGMTGLQKLLIDGVSTGTVNSITGIGALDETTIFDQVEKFVDGISQVYQGVAMNVFMSPYWAKAYLRDKRTNGFYQIKSSGEIDNSIDFAPQSVVALPSMAGTTDIFATPKENLIHLGKKDMNKNRFNIEESKRQVFLMTDWWEAVGFGINQAVWTNVVTR
jgi:hypothetical protein